jgi:hypothetical protein
MSLMLYGIGSSAMRSVGSAALPTIVFGEHIGFGDPGLHNSLVVV